MPEFVACPACGCRVQMADSMIGRPVRCINCDHRFTATSPAEVETRRVEPLPPPEPPTPPASGRRVPADWTDQPAHAGRSPGRSAGEGDEDHRPPPTAGLPCCPRCGRPVPWNAFRCTNCGQQLEFDGAPGGFYRRRLPQRRDAEEHRGSLVSFLGNLTLASGGLALCLAGFPMLVALPLGIATCLMASRDLQKMRSGEMDPDGRNSTESGRTSAVTGMVLSLIFAAGWGLLLLLRWLQ